MQDHSYRTDWGRIVQRDWGGKQRWVAEMHWPDEIAAAFRKAGRPLKTVIHQPYQYTADTLKITRTEGVMLADRPGLRSLIDRLVSIRQAEQAEREARWERERQADLLLIDAANGEADEYAYENCPADCTLLETAHDALAADGWGSTTYRHKGQDVHQASIDLTQKIFCAVRPGALGAFWHRVVAWAPTAQLGDLVARLNEQAVQPVPPIEHGHGYCYSCQSYCYGDCGDYQPEETPAIVARRLREAFVESNYGITD